MVVDRSLVFGFMNFDKKKRQFQMLKLCVEKFSVSLIVL